MSAALGGDVAALVRLRRQGRAGFQQVLAKFAAPERTGSIAQWERLLDTLAGQRDAKYSGLFWERDLAQAQVQAQRRGVPILSLRMLGKLTDEHSCANSRFFRTVLYADPQLARWLDQNFVLHWSSERPVPQVTIDFGGGRTVHTTTTGNSAHYVLDAHGHPLDVLPGLYAPKVFRAELEAVLRMHKSRLADGAQPSSLHTNFHRAALEQLQRSAAQQLGLPSGRHQQPLRAWMLTPPDNGGNADAPAAVLAQPISLGKMSVEIPVLRGLELRSIVESLGEPTPSFERRAIAALKSSVSLSASAVALMRRDRPRRMDESAAQYKTRIAALRARFEDDVAGDTAGNQYRLHAQIHAHMAESPDASFEQLNAWMYSSLFLTPAGDPWLGLVDDAVYDGLVEAGIASLAG